MKASLGDASPTEFANGEKLDQHLVQFLGQGLTQIDGAVVFTAMRDTAERVRSEQFPDLTGFECFVNHIHIEDQLEEFYLVNLYFQFFRPERNSANVPKISAAQHSVSTQLKVISYRILLVV